MSSRIVLPNGRPYIPDSQQPSVSIKTGDIELPQHLKEDLEVNPHMREEFYKGVGKAMNYALSHPATRPRVFPPTEEMIKELLHKCYDALEILRHDMKFPLRKCFDLLPAGLVESLKRGVSIADVLEPREDDTMWERVGSFQERVDLPSSRGGADISSTDLAAEAADTPVEAIADGPIDEEMLKELKKAGNIQDEDT